MISVAVATTLGLSVGPAFATAPSSHMLASLAVIQSQPAINVRSGQHPTFSRLVFDLGSRIDYEVVKTNQTIAVTINQPSQINWGRLVNEPLDQISLPEHVVLNDRTIASFTVSEDATFKHYQTDTSIVVDVVAATAPNPASETNPSDQVTPNDETISDATAGTANRSLPLPFEPDDDSDAIGESSDGSSPDSEIELPTPPAPAQPTVGSVAMPDDRELFGVDDMLIVQADPVERGVQLTFPWQWNVGMASFKRGPYVWIVFDSAADFDNRQVIGSDAAAGRVINATQEGRSDITVMRYRINGNQSVKAGRNGTYWHVILQDVISKPRIGFDGVRESAAAGEGGQLFYNLGQESEAFRLEDPYVGDRIFVVPVTRVGGGVSDPVQYAEVNVLETAQGMAVEPLADGVQVTPARDGVAISTGAGLAIATEEIGESLITDAAEASGRPFELNAWKVGPDNRFRANESRLLHRLSSVGLEGDRNPGRWDLARYYLAHQRPAETLGYLKLMLGSNPALLENTEFRGVRGIARARMHHFDIVMEDLSLTDLQADQDIALWRALALEQLEQYEKAVEAWRIGRDIVGGYGPNERFTLQLSALRAAIEIGEIVLAGEEIRILEGQELSYGQLEELGYQKGRLMALTGDREGARTAWESLKNSADLRVRARANYALVSDSLDNGEIDAEAAIAELERIRYIWRGSNFELGPLEDLATLYREQNRYDEALSRYQLGVNYYDEDLRSKAMRLEMSSLFKQLFLDGEADELPAIQAIALFYKYRLLAPQGESGDVMVRRLTARLVSVELLDKAAEHLLHQVQNRYSDRPFARAQVASQLAKVYIMDNQYEAAISILRATRDSQLPADITDERMMVEARALIQTEKYEEAEVLLERSSGRDVDLMRSEIYLGRRDWPRLLATNDRLLGNAWSEPDALEDQERLLLVWSAIALELTDDESGSAQLRNRYSDKMRTGRFSTAFEMLTGNEFLSGNEITDIVSEVASIDRLQGFMQEYRDDFQAVS